MKQVPVLCMLYNNVNSVQQTVCILLLHNMLIHVLLYYRDQASEGYRIHMFKGMVFKTNDFVKDTVAFLIIKKKAGRMRQWSKEANKNKQSDPRTTRNAHMNSIYNI